MAWQTTEEIRASQGIDPSFTDTLIETASFLAEKHLSLCMKEDFTPHKSDPEIIQAHAALTAYYVYQNSVRITASGAVKTEQDSASALSQTMQNTYFSPKELENLQNGVFAKAKMLVSEFCDLSKDCTEKPDTGFAPRRFGSFKAYKPAQPKCRDGSW